MVEFHVGQPFVIAAVDQAGDACMVDRKEAVASALWKPVRSRHSIHAATPPHPLLLILLDGKHHWDMDFLTNKMHRGPAKVKEMCKRQVGAL